MDLSQQQVIAMAAAIGLEIPAKDLENVRLRLSAMLTSMQEIERALGAEMDRIDPVPPINLPDNPRRAE